MTLKAIQDFQGHVYFWEYTPLFYQRLFHKHLGADTVDNSDINTGEKVIDTY